MTRVDEGILAPAPSPLAGQKSCCPDRDPSSGNFSRTTSACPPSPPLVGSESAQPLRQAPSILRTQPSHPVSDNAPRPKKRGGPSGPPQTHRTRKRLTWRRYPSRTSGQSCSWPHRPASCRPPPSRTWPPDPPQPPSSRTSE